ncbi:L-rhamnose mutarotase [Lachnotalea glycerini]|uniref:L-rhamnose mutarotase n=1 Tax=Lachnotalea glycerini TaxID=1763509 RepID=A0A255IG68_9FIRM|nr:L-rhamnose mutarotase [Lachnotalea glycerini]PXV86274.1 L-rhamnose mutarotase [Lachnotalea glycerini]RDY31556.1 L-rhamnose mutarotase [Lachnotalea glycerini]
MRIGRVVKVKADMKERYKQLHAKPWAEVTKAIHDCNIKNFSIYLKGELLFSYFEYIGDNYAQDMKALDELTKDWLKETDQCQEPVEGALEGELWSVMEEVFYQE